MCRCGGLTPAHSQQLLAHSPHTPSRTRQRIGRAKVKKRVGQDKDSEISEGKRKKKTKAMQRQSLTATSHKETDALPPSEQWPCPRYLAPVLLPSMTLCRKEYPSGHLGPAVHVVSLPDFLSPPSLLEAIKRGSLVTVRVLLSNSKSTGLATKPEYSTSYSEEHELHPSQTQYSRRGNASC